MLSSQTATRLTFGAASMKLLASHDESSVAPVGVGRHRQVILMNICDAIASCSPEV